MNMCDLVYIWLGNNNECTGKRQDILNGSLRPASIPCDAPRSSPELPQILKQFAEMSRMLNQLVG
jgi:hypothetical protein